VDLGTGKFFCCFIIWGQASSFKARVILSAGTLVDIENLSFVWSGHHPQARQRRGRPIRETTKRKMGEIFGIDERL
jgi:hypothetical protein